MGNSNYANQEATTTSLENTGSTSNNDIKCNIYDMAGNVSELTTEYSANSYDEGNVYPCVFRGGIYDTSDNYTVKREECYTTFSWDNIGFRPLLYLR